MYVANRVAQIQLLLLEAQWRRSWTRQPGRFCIKRNSSQRASALSDMERDRLASQGRTLLVGKEPESSQGRTAREESDHAPRCCLETEPKMLLRFSSLHRFLRVTVWCRRWRHSVTRKRLPGDATPKLVLIPAEINEALHRWLRVVQSMYYADEIATIIANCIVAHRSSLFKLSPFLDCNGVLRVGGRFKHAILSDDERHPMIAPPTSWLIQLIVESSHQRTLHGGVQLTLCLLRQRFWILREQVVVKQLLHWCVTCIRGEPPHRNYRWEIFLTSGRPFLRIGLDYAGPFQIRTSKGRGHRSYKGFIAVFVCLCMRAVHLELASDYTTEAFLATFRFTSRRGLCTDLYSDCDTNFIGADRELRKLFKASSSDGRRIAHTTGSHGVRWLQSPAAPHFGRVWEAVKSTKYYLRQVIGEATLTFEEFSTSRKWRLA